MSKIFRASVIGLGQMGLMYDLDPKRERPSSHALAYHLNPQFELVSGMDTRHEQSNHLHKLVPESIFYTDVASMLDTHSLHVISICTPPAGRLELIKEVLSRDTLKVIFCEKPVASTIDEAIQISELGKLKDCVIIPNLSRRWNTGIQQVKATIDSETLGPLINVHARYTRGIFNTGSHLFDLIRLFAGNMEYVAVTEKVQTSSDIEGEPSFSFYFRTVNGVGGHSDAFDDRNYYMFEIDLFFAKGKIEITRSGDQITYFSVGEHPLFSGFSSLQLMDQQSGLLSQSNLKNAVQHIVDVLQGQASPLCTIEDGIYPMLVAQALIRSYENEGSKEKVGIDYE